MYCFRTKYEVRVSQRLTVFRTPRRVPQASPSGLVRPPPHAPQPTNVSYIDHAWFLALGGLGLGFRRLRVYVQNVLMFWYIYRRRSKYWGCDQIYEGPGCDLGSISTMPWWILGCFGCRARRLLQYHRELSPAALYMYTIIIFKKH